jgi:chromosome segregation ATPase
LRAALGAVGTDVASLADRRSDAAYDFARKLYSEADTRAREANSKSQDANRRVGEAADRVASKRRELSTLASDLSRARDDLRIATELVGQARQEARVACVEMTELDLQVRIARNMLRGPAYLFPARALANDDRPTSRK